MKQKSRKIKSSKAKKSTSVKKNTQKWGVFLNACCVVGPFIATDTSGYGDYYDKEGMYEATELFNSKEEALNYVIGANAARKAIFRTVFTGCEQLTSWIEDLKSEEANF